MTVTNMASKQDLDVVESWEEIDEIDVLEQKLRKLLPSSSICVENKLGNCDGNTNGTPINIILTGDDAFRSQYVPPEPAVKILKRPANHILTNNWKTSHPKKTLQQREEEYAQARLRILGEPQSGVEEKVCTIQKQSRLTELNNVIRYPRGPDGTKGFKTPR